MATFESLGVCAELCQITKSIGWLNPTKIQQESIPAALEGRDLIALAETGSGKTGAFSIPVLQKLLDEPKRMFALVLAPTRELCVQIAETFEALGASISLQTCVLVGGLDMVTQALSLSKKPHVIIATPGRLVDHLQNTKGFHLKSIRFLIMDEADRLLSMDFEEALDSIVQACNPERQTFLFSATMTSKVSKLQRAALRKPMKVEVNTKFDTASTLTQNYMLVPFKFKQTYMVALLSHFAKYTGIIFIDTCLNAQKLTMILRHLGFAAVCLHGKMTQVQRLGALSQFKSGNKKILVATDVASRGLDIPAVDLVVNFDLPKNQKDYIHRVGRTARAGKIGRAVSFVTQYDVEEFKKIEQAIDKQLEEFPDVTESVAMPFHERVLEAARAAHLELKEKQDEIVESLGAGAKRNKKHKIKKLLLTK